MQYQFFNVDSAGTDAAASERSCLNDVSAMMHAKSILGEDYLVEIWQGTRAVGHMGQVFGHWFLGETQAARPGDEVSSPADSPI